MSFYYEFGVADEAAVKAFVETHLTAEGFSKVYEIGDDVGYRINNELTEASGTEAFFCPVFTFSTNTFKISLAKSLTAVAADGLLNSANVPSITSHEGPYDVFMVANRLRVVLAIKSQANGSTKALVAASLDFRELDPIGVAANPTNLANLKNNNQCVFKVGNEIGGRLLYAGNDSSPSLFDRPLELDTLTQNKSYKKSPQGDTTIPVPTVLAGSSNNFQGLLSGIFLVDSSAVHIHDRGVDTAGNFYRCFRDSVSGDGILAKELP